MLKEIITLIFRPKTAEDAMLLGEKYWRWWCEQRGVIELPTAPDHIKNPFIEELSK